MKTQDLLDDDPMIMSLAAPPERHAERVVDEMIRWMHKSAPSMLRGVPIIDPYRMGGPRGQRRTMERLKHSLSGLLLACHLVTGKRGRYQMGLTFWYVWDQAKSEIVKSGAPVPHGAGLVAVLVLLEGPGWAHPRVDLNPPKTLH